MAWSGGNVESNFESKRPNDAILHGRFLGEGIYNYGAPLKFSIDLDGDGKDETVCFRHDNGAEVLTVSRFDKILSFLMPEEMFRRDAENMRNESELYHVAIKDVNKDGLPEVLIANRPAIGEVVACIWGFKEPGHRSFERGCFDLIKVIKGQHSVMVQEGGRIRLPYGSIGSAFVYDWHDDHFEESHVD